MNDTPRPLQVGDMVVNNRNPHRECYQVDQFNQDGKTVIVARSAHNWAHVHIADIHLDGKPRRSGWSRVEP